MTERQFKQQTPMFAGQYADALHGVFDDEYPNQAGKADDEKVGLAFPVDATTAVVLVRRGDVRKRCFESTSTTIATTSRSAVALPSSRYRVR